MFNKLKVIVQVLHQQIEGGEGLTDNADAVDASWRMGVSDQKMMM